MEFKKTLSIIMLFFGFFVLSNSAFGQSPLPGTNNGEIRIIPTNLKPDQIGRAVFESYITDLDRARIQWYLNEKLVKEGLGETTLEFKNGAVGQKTTIRVLVLTEEGWPIQDQLELYSAEVSLVYEAESYTPPFYRGKAKLPYEGVARVIALPNFKTENGEIINNQNLIFKWYRKNKLEQSGTGKNVFRFKGSVPMSVNEIRVEVSTIDRTYFAENRIEFLQEKSLINFYENSVEYGILYNKALNPSLDIGKNDLNLIASPFFFNILDVPFLQYSWVLGGKNLPENTSQITLSGGSNRSGSSFVQLEVRNPASIYQFSSQNATINVKRSI